MITIHDLTHRSNLDDSDNWEPSEPIIFNVHRLCDRLNRLLLDDEIRIFIDSDIISVAINSGLRSPARNAAAGGAERSWHMTGHAVDVSDVGNRIGNFFLANQHILKRHGLYMENPSHTPSWCHLQDMPPKSRNIVFYP